MNTDVLRSFLLLLSALTLQANASAADTVVIDGQAFEVTFKKKERQVCPKDGQNGSDWRVVSKSAEAVYLVWYEADRAACRIRCLEDSGCLEECDSEEVSKKRKQRALHGVFDFFRDFPSRYVSAACKEARDSICVPQCENVGVFDHMDCLIGCNQFEAYNK